MVDRNGIHELDDINPKPLTGHVPGTEDVVMQDATGGVQLIAART
jgi:hypothetical protein